MKTCAYHVEKVCHAHIKGGLTMIVLKSKVSTGRAVVYQQLGIRSYTVSLPIKRLK